MSDKLTRAEALAAVTAINYMLTSRDIPSEISRNDLMSDMYKLTEPSSLIDKNSPAPAESDK